MNTPHVTVWINVDSAKAQGLSRRDIAAFRTQIDHLLAFVKMAGGPQVENWSMFGDTNLSVDIALTSAAVDHLERLLTADGLPRFSRYNLFRAEDVDPAIVAAVEATAVRLGLPASAV